MEQKSKLIIRIIIIVVLLMLMLITSFISGTRLFNIEEKITNKKSSNINGKAARWNFKAKIIVRNEVYYDEDI